jgi:hypothetical protein
MRMKSWLAGVMVLGLVSQTWATEGDGGAYASGGEGTMTGALPPPGMYFLNYDLYYHADSLKGDTGHSLPIDFKLNVFADVMRFVNVTPVEVLGGNWAQHVIVPIMSEDVKMKGAGSDHDFGLGDIIVDPFIIGWHKPPFHWIVGVDTYLPTGKYHGSSLANLGRNYWTIEPVAAVTYLNEGGQELSAKLMYDFNTENPETDYLSGEEFHTDFAALQHVNDWAFGLGGYYYYQTTDDQLHGVTVLGGNQGRQIALGPQVSYEVNHMSFVLSWDHEFDTKNRPQGDALWFKFVMPL